MLVSQYNKHQNPIEKEIQQNHIRELADQLEVKKSLTIPYFEWVMAKTPNT